MALRRFFYRTSCMLLALALMCGPISAVFAAPASPPSQDRPPHTVDSAPLPAAGAAGAPTDVDITGPGHVDLGRATWYTATVAPADVAVPVTFTWTTAGTPAHKVVTTDELVVAQRVQWADWGTQYITVTVDNALGSATHVRKVWVNPPPQPDLTVTDLHYDPIHRILYVQLMNVGDQAVTGDFNLRTYSSPDSYTDTRITRDLAPGQRLTPMIQNVPCRGASTTYRAVVDARNEIRERDETNNERRETLSCDLVPPRITKGPTVSGVGQETATISWQTDEDATSRVLYGTRKGAFDLSAPTRPTALAQLHQVVLTGLRPGSTYEYKVQSADAAGNVTESRPATFETASATAPAPPAPDLRLVRDPDNPGAYLLEAAFTDASNVAKVAFLLNDAPVGTDYGGGRARQPVSAQGDRDLAPSPLDASPVIYRAAIAPLKLGYTRETFFSRPGSPVAHAVQAVVTTYDRSASFEYSAVTQAYSTDEPIDVDLAIVSPPPDHRIYIGGGATPAGSIRTVQIHAAQYDAVCEYGAGALTLTPDCTEVMRPVAALEILFDSETVKNVTPGADVYDIEQHIDVGNLAPGQHWIEVRAWDTEGKHYHTSSPIEVVQMLPSLEVTRSVRRHGNSLLVALTVQNAADATAYAYLKSVTDYVRAFQLATSDTAAYRVTSVYTTDAGDDARQNEITIDFPDQPGGAYEIPQGGSVTLSYWLVPILYEDEPAYEIGQKPVAVQYATVSASGPDAQSHFSRPWSQLPPMVSDALRSADMPIVTNPGQLQAANPAAGDVDRLLIKMAELARRKFGVLGYLDTMDSGAFDALINAGGSWASRLSRQFQQFPGAGSLLIVGEETIVPAFEVGGLGYSNIPLSDQPYANADTWGMPMIAVGRAIGDTAVDLIKPLQASIDVHLDPTLYDASHAWLVAGGGGGERDFDDAVDAVETLLTTELGMPPANIFKEKASTYHVRAEVAYPFGAGDALALGYVTGGTKAEGVVGDALEDFIRLIDPLTGLIDYDTSFAHSFDLGDQVAVGNLLPMGFDEIVMGDISSGKIHVFSTATTSFTPGPGYGFAVDSLLAVGDVTGDGVDEILVGLTSPGRLYVYDATGQEIAGAGFDFPFGPHDGLAVGYLSGAPEAEIVIVDASAEEYAIYDRTGAILTEKRWFPYGSGSRIAVGNVIADTTAPIGDEIVITDADLRYIKIYRFDVPNNKIKKVTEIHVPTLSATDMLAVGDVRGDSQAEILIASSDRGTITVYDRSYAYDFHNAIRPETPDRDLLFIMGHGNLYGWDGMSDLPYGFGDARPLAYSCGCFMGNYTGRFMDNFFARNGGAFVGATKEARFAEMPDAVERFVGHLRQVGFRDNAAGRALLDQERYYATLGGGSGGDGWAIWVYEYNFYGDPKFGTHVTVPDLAATASGAARATAAATTALPAKLVLELPELVVTSTHGIDYVTIPSGTLWLRDGDPQVPIYHTMIEVPAGTRVQDVKMDIRGGLESYQASGWQLPVNTAAILPEDQGIPVPSAEDATFPAPDVPFVWQVLDNPDGSATLGLTVYPFFYHPLNTDVAYYRHYEFSFTTITPTVSITQLRVADEASHEPGDTVAFELGIQNATGAAPLDVVFEAEVHDLLGNLVSGLLLRNLHDLSGPAAFAPVWDTTGVPAGDYQVVAVLRDAEGQVLDREFAGFRLGAMQGEVTALTVDPVTFSAGPHFTIAMAFANTGSTPITGTAVLEIHPMGGAGSGAIITGTLVNVAPGATAIFTTPWDATGLPDQDYRITGYVTYGGGGTAMLTVDLPLHTKIFLPLVLRQ